MQGVDNILGLLSVLRENSLVERVSPATISAILLAESVATRESVTSSKSQMFVNVNFM